MRSTGKDNVMFALKALVTAVGIVTVGGLVTMWIVATAAGGMG